MAPKTAHVFSLDFSSVLHFWGVTVALDLAKEYGRLVVKKNLNLVNIGKLLELTWSIEEILKCDVGRFD